MNAKCRFQPHRERNSVSLIVRAHLRVEFETRTTYTKKTLCDAVCLQQCFGGQ